MKSERHASNGNDTSVKEGISIIFDSTTFLKIKTLSKLLKNIYKKFLMNLLNSVQNSRNLLEVYSHIALN